MDKALISLSFDDGRVDNYKAFKEITIPRKIPVTLNIITGYIDGDLPTEEWPSGKKPLKKEEVIELSKNPLFEIALHGNTHQNTEQDVRDGRDKLAEWIGSPEDEKWGFASPFSRMPVQEFISPSVPAFFKEDILYMRTGGKKIKDRTVRFRNLCMKANKVLHIPGLYRIAYPNVIMDACKDRVIYSFALFHRTRYSEVKGLINATVKYKGALTLMLHSIEAESAIDDDWSWDTEKFRQLCDYLAKLRDEGKIEILTTKDLYNRIKA